MIITSCDHTGITVCDIERSLAFWTTVMGCKVAYRIKAEGEDARCITGVPGAELLIAMLDAPGGHRIELLQYLAPAERAHFRPRPCDVGSVHVAFTVDNIEEMLAGLLAAGCVVHGKPCGPPGRELVYLHDFDGVTIELMQQPKRME
ncbi:glyoxalase/bleomycin resistance protein/dioxygenase [Mycena epipterygia]|nr:glyoxalase/bleomycin resistance protein/dioxygenase [Mycena epipterygia]